MTQGKNSTVGCNKTRSKKWDKRHTWKVSTCNSKQSSTVGKVAFEVAEWALSTTGGMGLPGKGDITLSGVYEEWSGGSMTKWKRAPGNKFGREIGEMIYLVKCLPSKYKDLSSDLYNPCKNPGMVVHACNPSTEEADTGGPHLINIETGVC